MSTVFEGPTRLAGAAQTTNTHDFIRVVEKVVTWEDLTAAATTETEAFAALPANCILLGVAYKLEEVFAGGTIAAMTMQLGDGSDADRFSAVIDVFTGATTGAFTRADPANPGGAADVYPLALASAITPTLTFTSTTGNTTAATTGRVRVWISYIAMQDPTVIA